MRIVSEYRQRAEESRKLAKLAASPEDRNLFEDMAQKWDMLADLRIGDIEPEDPKRLQFLPDVLAQKDSVLTLRIQPWRKKNSLNL
jgi:hypothetical protein